MKKLITALFLTGILFACDEEEACTKCYYWSSYQQETVNLDTAVYCGLSLNEIEELSRTEEVDVDGKKVTFTTSCER